MRWRRWISVLPPYEDKGDTRSKDAEVDIAIAYGVELFYKTLIESISKDDKMDEVTE